MHQSVFFMLLSTDRKAYGVVEALYSVHHLLIATPGRLVELLATHAVTLERVTLLTIDEADRMMELGFEEQLNVISQAIRPDRQTLLFSATFPCVLHIAYPNSPVPAFHLVLLVLD